MPKETSQQLIQWLRDQADEALKRRDAPNGAWAAAWNDGRYHAFSEAASKLEEREREKMAYLITNAQHWTIIQNYTCDTAPLNAVGLELVREVTAIADEAIAMAEAYGGL